MQKRTLLKLVITGGLLFIVWFLAVALTQVKVQVGTAKCSIPVANSVEYISSGAQTVVSFADMPLQCDRDLYQVSMADGDEEWHPGDRMTCLVTRRKVYWAFGLVPGDEHDVFEGRGCAKVK